MYFFFFFYFVKKKVLSIWFFGLLLSMIILEMLNIIFDNLLICIPAPDFCQDID